MILLPLGRLASCVASAGRFPDSPRLRKAVAVFKRMNFVFLSLRQPFIVPFCMHWSSFVHFGHPWSGVAVPTTEMVGRVVMPSTPTTWTLAGATPVLVKSRNEFGFK